MKKTIIIGLMGLMGLMSVGARAQNGTWTMFDTRTSDICGNNISAITADDNSILWAGSYQGLCRLKGNTWTDYAMFNEKNDFFVLFDFSAKWDWIPTMLTQNHTRLVHGFMGQTTAFRREQVKTSCVILGDNKELGEVRYLHGEYGKGTWTFLGGHDPEDYRHFIGDPPTDLSLYPNSPGYRLILNNILFPAAKKEKHKT